MGWEGFWWSKGPFRSPSIYEGWHHINITEVGRYDMKCFLVLFWDYPLGFKKIFKEEHVFSSSKPSQPSPRGWSSTASHSNLKRQEIVCARYKTLELLRSMEKNDTHEGGTPKGVGSRKKVFGRKRMSKIGKDITCICKPICIYNYVCTYIYICIHVCFLTQIPFEQWFCEEISSQTFWGLFSRPFGGTQYRYSTPSWQCSTG